MHQPRTQNHALVASTTEPGSVPACPPFPTEGKVRAKQAAAYLAIGLSTFWLYVKQGRVAKPMRFGARVSVWDASYIRELASNGIPLEDEEVK